MATATASAGSDAVVGGILSSIPALSPLDADVTAYLCAVLSEAGIREGEEGTELVQQLVQPFLESFCIADKDIPAALAKIHKGLGAAGLLLPPDSGKELDASALAVLLAGGKLEDEESKGATRMLSAPVKLGAKASADTSTLDFLWGKETNSFLQQNSSIDCMEVGDHRTFKRAARDAKREESRRAYEAERAAEKAKEEAAAEAATGTVSSGTVTYTLTEVRKAQDICITGFNMGYGGELLLENSDLKIVSGRRYGLVGRNGMGKSTLLRHMARGDVAGSGTQRFPKDLRTLHVEQEVVGDDCTVLDTVLAADVERDMLLKEEATLHASIDAASEDAYAEGGAGGKGTSSTAGTASSSRARTLTKTAASVATNTTSALSTAVASGGGGAPLDRFDVDAANERLRVIALRLAAIDSDTADSRASSILSGLGFTKEMQSWPTRSLSGGWRMRVALTCALFCEPDILCLDEPTNHIDARSLVWLVDYLLTYPHTLIIVSHDRWFLNAVCSDIIHLYNKKLDYYKGDYETFERTRAERRRHTEKAVETQDAKRKHVQAFIDKFRYNAKRASLVQSRIKALERMDVLEDVADDPKWKFEFPNPGPLGIPVLQIDDVAFGYKLGKPLFRDVNFSIDSSSRIALVGPNGVGKSTLLKLILGELEPQEGSVVRNPKLRMACFTQHHVNQLDLSLTPLDYLLHLFPGSKPDMIRPHLGSFGISGDLALQVMGTMSGGQKSRVAFSILTWKKPHILILDEPSNNLDIETIDAVIVALANFEGGVIVVSHDQHFVESVCDEIYVVGNPAGRVTKFKGEFKDYRKVAETEKAFKLGGDEDSSAV